MKLIQVIVRPFKLEDVRNTLTQLGVQNLIIYEARDLNYQNLVNDDNTFSNEKTQKMLPRLMLSCAVPDEKVNDVVNQLIRVSRCGKQENDHIYIYPLESVISIDSGLEVQ